MWPGSEGPTDDVHQLRTILSLFRSRRRITGALIAPAHAGKGAARAGSFRPSANVERFLKAALCRVAQRTFVKHGGAAPEATGARQLPVWNRQLRRTPFPSCPLTVKPWYQPSIGAHFPKVYFTVLPAGCHCHRFRGVLGWTDEWWALR